MYSLKRRGGKRWLFWILAVILIALAGVYVYWSMNRPLPDLKPVSGSAGLQASTPGGKLAWPGTGQAAVGILDSPILQSHGNQTPAPTASTAKLITALVVLEQKPLKPGAQGPDITMTANDVAIYNAYLAHDGSLAKVQAGEKISEYQVLQTILLPSANNMADSLAIWAFGSPPAYSAAANQYLSQHGLTQTHVGKDASGFDPGTTSTARDLVKIGELAMQNPVLAQIAGQTTASGIPVVGNIKNVNFLLGTNNIIGIKTGNTDQAGGVYVSASRVKVNGRPVTIVTALVGSPSLFQALKDSLPLIKSAQANFGKITVVKSGQAVGTYDLPWGGSVAAVASRDLTASAWKGSPVKAVANLKTISANAEAGQTVGSMTVSGPVKTGQTIDIKLSASPVKPSLWWRLAHPF